MKFLIKRASQSSYDKPPCDNCNAIETEGFFGKKQFKYYRNFNSIDELLAFIDEVDTSIVINNSNEPTITIYDDYIE